MNSPLASGNERDRELERRVIAYLRLCHISSLRRIVVEVQEGIVTLHGRVQSFYQRQLCLNCCQRVAGFVKLIDLIEVAADDESVLAV